MLPWKTRVHSMPSNSHLSPSTIEMKPLAEETINNVRQQLRQGRSARKVASNLKVSISSALKIRNMDKENIPAPKMGRPTKISNETRRVLARQFNNGILRTLQDGQQMVQSSDGGQVHVRTVQRLLKSEGVKAYVQQKKPGVAYTDMFSWHALPRSD